MKKIRTSKPTIFAALSGGVDSSVAAALLKEHGFEVRGVHMKMWSPEGSNQQPATGYQRDVVCRQQYQDRIDAMRAAAHLGIPFETWDFTDEYRRAVVEYMIGEYAAGRTPNPDVMCNKHIKFGLFLKRALAEGADWVATGHYVRLRRTDENDEIGESGETARPKQFHQVPAKPERFTKRSDSPTSLHRLLTAGDASKDQSYFLWTLTQDQLKHCLFPIGEYTKPEVRAMARKLGLPTAEKPDSQGVCFIGEFDMTEFLKGYIPEKRGTVLTTSGKIVGEHNGVEFYTIGERHGIGIGGGIPYYVAAKDPDTNTLTVAEGPYDGNLFKKELIATDINWISGQEPKIPLRCEARIRYRQPTQPCRVERIKKQELRSRDGSVILNSGFMLRAFFAEPQRAVTPGQSVVFYRGGEMLGGGIID